MKAVVYDGPRQVTTKEVPDAKIVEEFAEGRHADRRVGAAAL